MSKHREDEIRRLVKSACKPVATPPEFRKRLLERLVLEAINKQLLEYPAKGEAPEDGCETKG